MNIENSEFWIEIQKSRTKDQSWIVLQNSRKKPKKFFSAISWTKMDIKSKRNPQKNIYRHKKTYPK